MPFQSISLPPSANNNGTFFLSYDFLIEVSPRQFSQTGLSVVRHVLFYTALNVGKLKENIVENQLIVCLETYTRNLCCKRFSYQKASNHSISSCRDAHKSALYGHPSLLHLSLLLERNLRLENRDTKILEFEIFGIQQ